MLELEWVDELNKAGRERQGNNEFRKQRNQCLTTLRDDSLTGYLLVEHVKCCNCIIINYMYCCKCI